MESTNNSEPTHVVIVDDHKMVVDSLSRLINESGIAQITGVYYDLKSCRRGLATMLPEVLLLDIGLPDGDGVDFCAEIKKEYPELKIIMLTTYKEFSIAKRALHNGALGYILKNAESEEMLAGIETVSKGKQFLCEEIDILLKEKRDEGIVWLSNREKEVLKYIADGYTTKGIADLIYRDVETVRSCRKNLLIKIVAKNTAVLVKKGYEMKLIW
ncbi:MAG: response regulator transcription factor [Dysgonamonadaceae bacterium]|jgi:DNA-binding NarL/FixJ family response regulator|nr:response regulator transcription factor [Dysgonamonadaceae bacterium]